MAHFISGQTALLRFTVCATFLAIAATFGVGDPALAQATPEAPHKRAAVISMVGDRLIQRQIGVTVFGNEFEDYDATDLGLDAAWEAKIRDAASSYGPFDFVDVEFDRAALLATYPKKSNWINTLRHLRFKKTQPIFAQIAADNHLDTLIVLGADAYNVIEGVMDIEGAGIYTTKSLGGKKSIYYLISQLALIDGATGMPIETAYLTVGSRWKKIYGGFPVVDVPEALTGKDYPSYTAEEKEFLKGQLTALADPALPRSMAKLFGAETPDEDEGEEEPADAEAEAEAEGAADAPAEALPPEASPADQE